MENKKDLEQIVEICKGRLKEKFINQNGIFEFYYCPYSMLGELCKYSSEIKKQRRCCNYYVKG